MGATTTQERPTDIYRLPDEKVLEEAGALPVLDKDGNKVDLNSFYTNQPAGEKQLIVFIRHFLCGVSCFRAATLFATNPKRKST
jgi:hypothetical protein